MKQGENIIVDNWLNNSVISRIASGPAFESRFSPVTRLNQIVLCIPKRKGMQRASTGNNNHLCKLIRIYQINVVKYSKTSMARTLWNHENMFETRVVRANEC